MTLALLQDCCFSAIVDIERAEPAVLVEKQNKHFRIKVDYRFRKNIRNQKYMVKCFFKADVG
jgi:hypothetical protein